MRLTHSMLVAAAAAMVLAGCGDGASPTSPPRGSEHVSQAAAANRGDWIVVFRDGTPGAQAFARDLVARHGGVLHHTYHNTISGFSATLPAAAAEQIRRDPRVLSVTADPTVRVIQATTQNSAPWGLDRIDQAALPLSTTYTYGNSGAGVTVYIIDTGIDTGHSDFGGRASAGFDACFGGCATGDPHGHGTHVAGIVGSATYGVAKGVSLVSIRVTNSAGGGTAGSIIAGVDTVTGFKRQNPSALMVANMSVSIAGDANLDSAVVRAIRQGVTIVAGSGNNDTTACNNSPGRVPEVVTVGGTTRSDRRVVYPGWWGSNWGNCVDVHAPGDSIVSTWPGGGTNMLSGTSQASPHAAGYAAVYLQTYSLSTPANVHNAIVVYATPNVLQGDLKGAPNKLLYTSYGGGGRIPGCCR